MSSFSLKDKEKHILAKKIDFILTLFFHSSTVKNESELGQTMIVTQANNFEMTRPRKIMQPIDGQIAVTKDLLGQLGQLTASDLSTPERLLPDHKAPTYNPDDRTKRHVDIGNFK